MQNEFEKQVQKKLEELNLTPSEPVWHHIEKQIRTKKDRRILFLWLPLLTGILAGGFLWLNNSTFSRPHNYKVQVQTNKNDQLKNDHVNVNLNENTKETRSIDQAVEMNSESNELKVIKKSELTYQRKNRSLQKSNASKYQDIVQAGHLVADKVINSKEKVHFIPNKSEKNEFYSSVNSSMDVNSSVEENDNRINYLPERFMLSFENIHIEPVELIKVNNGPWKSGIKKDDLTSDLANQLKNNNKWKFGFIVKAGYTGSGANTDMAKSLSGSSSVPSTGPPYISYFSPIINKGVAFTAGFSIQKKISNKVLLSSGIQYNYYSTINKVGQRIVHDTVINMAAISAYYQDVFSSPNNNQGQSGQVVEINYHNQFHHISIPVSVDAQVINSLPLFFHASISVHRLISTNALLNNGIIYYHDRSAFTKTQLFTEAGIHYSIIRKHNFTFTAGPQFEYGLSKNDHISSNHLYTIGISTQFLFSSGRR